MGERDHPTTTAHQRDIVNPDDQFAAYSTGDLREDRERDEIEHLRETYKQTSTFRKKLFTHILYLAYGCTAASIGTVVIWFIFFPPPPTAVGVALISGLTVEVIGLIAIMARSLFPKEGMSNHLGTPKPTPPIDAL